MRDLADDRISETDDLGKEVLLLRQKVQQLKEAESARNQLLDELQETQELFNQFMERSPIYIFFKDENVRSIRLSRNYERMLGRPIDELLGKTMGDLFPSELAQNMIRDDLHVLKCGKEITIEEEFNGRIYATSKYPIQYKGRPRYLAGFTVDITDQRQTEAALIESEEKFRNVFNLCPDPVCLNRLYNGKFIMVNQAFSNITGFTGADIIGKGSAGLWENIEDRDRLIAELGETGKVNSFEATLRAKEGKIIGLISASEIEINRVKYVLSIIRDITKYKQIENNLKESLDQVRLAAATTIQVLVSSVERRDPYTAGHQRRTADLARSIAKEMGLSRERIEGIRIAGTIHDLGKLAVPSAILSKTGKLTPLEYSFIIEHSRSGYDILKNVSSPWPLADIIHQHHERMDGSGYPNGLTEKEILLEAKILAVADVIEAMSSHRPYRPAFGIDMVLAEIEKNKGTLYDSDVANTVLRLFRERGFQFKIDQISLKSCCAQMR